MIAINTPIDLLASFLPVTRSSHEEPVPTHWWWLSAGVSPIEVERIDATTVLLRPEGGFLVAPWSRIFRAAARHPMKLGEGVSLAGLEIEVTALTPDARPREVRFEFDVPLEDETLHWMAWRNCAFEPFTVPAVGETVTVPGVRLSEFIPVALGFKDPPRDVT